MIRRNKTRSMDGYESSEYKRAERESVCEWVCVCVSERERERVIINITIIIILCVRSDATNLNHCT